MYRFDPPDQSENSVERIPETPDLARQGNIRTLPMRTQKPQSIDNLHDLQYPVLVEYRVANQVAGTRFLSMGVILIHSSDLYSDLLDTIGRRNRNWEHVSRHRRVKSIAVRWDIGQAIDDASYNTVCSPDDTLTRLMLMMRKREWKDRLVVVYCARDDGSAFNSESGDGCQTSPILGGTEDGDGKSSSLEDSREL